MIKYVHYVSDWQAALQAEERDDWAEARQRLEACRFLWEYTAAWQGAYARALRCVGELTRARQHLLQAERLGYDERQVALEKALLRYAEGDRSVEAQLWTWYHQGGAQEAALIAAVLTPRLLSQFRLPEAGPVTARWVELRPASATAWKYRAQVLERLHPNSPETVAAWREWSRRAPADPLPRLGLARLLIQRREQLDEAATLLQQLLQDHPADEEARLLLAECHLLQGQADAALSLLDALIHDNTQQGRAYWLRGRWYLQVGDLPQAISDLRRAVERDPSTPDNWYCLFQALQQSGAPAEEVRQTEEKWRRCDHDLRRAGQLAKRIGEQPWDPELRRQLGELFLRNGQHTQGLRWLQSALEVQADHHATHQTLAEYYEQ
ncbi:MAG: tetratricopeptide repeat protein, partial [Gemmataceae bacterium]|nr:tetratricopeptide repeat protein [Gemmataceae bacterium]